MTNAELIAKLQQFPPDAVVVIDMHSECRDLDDDEPTLIRAEDRALIRHYPKGAGEESAPVYMSWNDRYKKPSDPDPEFVTAVHFPGN